ncbi:MAG: hypothetical protein H6728_09565 [Myxococcales bacterium]|nr:hypothetical protein [Myxococcales bacterium]
MSQQNITRKQFTQSPISTNNPELQSVMKAHYNEDFDVNGDGKLDLSDFDTNNDGKLDGKELDQLFKYADSFDQNKRSDSFKNQGVAGEIYAATKKDPHTSTQKTNASYRNKVANKPLTNEQKQLARTAFERIKSQIPSSLQSRMQEKLQKLAANGQLDWLKNSGLTPQATSFALLEQLTSFKQAREIAPFAEHPRLEQAFTDKANQSPKAQQEKSLTQTLFLRIASQSGNAFATRVLESGAFSGLTHTQRTQVLSVLLAHPNLAKQLAGLPSEKLGPALQTMAKDITQFQQFVSNADSGINSAVKHHQTAQVAQSIKEKPWLLASLPANEAQKLITTFLHTIGQMEEGKGSFKGENHLQETIKDALLTFKKDNPKMYSLFFGAAYQSVTGNPLPNWKEHMLSLASSLGVSTLPLGALAPFVGAGASVAFSKATGESDGAATSDAAGGLANDALLAAAGFSKAVAQRVSILLILLKTTVAASNDLVRNEIAQTGLGKFLEKAENAQIFP